MESDSEEMQTHENEASGSSEKSFAETASRSKTKMEAAVVDPEVGRGGQSTKNPPGKRKIKVDWTPELHKQFVQAVEELGLEKAVPSRILELMGINCLTRHNVASHLQKYRTHKRRLLAREAQLASSKQRHLIHGAADASDCNAPTMGFPPPNLTPCCVWGHPSTDQPFAHMWRWPQPPQAPLFMDPYFWYYSHHHGRYNYSTTLPVPGVPQTDIYRVSPPHGLPKLPAQPSFPIPPSKESVDRAIEDVLARPWLPLPIGLRPPSLDSVLVELQREGILKISPTH